MNDSDELPTIEEIEEQIPEDRKHMSFGGEGETIIDVMDDIEKEQHHHGKHMDEPLGSCPYCPDPENKRVSVQIVGADE